MYRVIIKPHWVLQHGSTTQSLPKLLALLSAIHEEGTLAGACRKLGLSYRHAWDLLRDSAHALGTPVVRFNRGKGTTLSPMGEKLLRAERRIAARLTPLFESLASEIETELQGELVGTHSVLRIHASHGFAVECLHDFLTRRGIAVEIKYCGSMEALDGLSRSNCALAGFHAPIGELQGLVLEYYVKWLKPRTQTLIDLATRRQGILVARGNPRSILSLPDLAQPGLRFVNRQLGSGTRILLGLLMKRQGVDVQTITGYDSGEFTHAAVAACIASGMADAGFGVETAARRFNLDFIPIISERYFFICDNVALASPEIGQVLETLRSNGFKAAVGNLPGYDASSSGKLMTIEEAFSELTETAGNTPSAAKSRR